MRVQEAQHALPGVRRYAETMADGLGTELLWAPGSAEAERRDGGHRALVLCTAEHGFVGAFTERIFAAAERLQDRDVQLFILGRAAALAHQRGWDVAWTHPIPTRPDGVPETIERLITALYRALAAGALTRVEVISARHLQGQAMAIERRLLFPVEPTPFATKGARPSPLHNLRAELLLEKLLADYVFARLTEAAIESVASENAARFAAMDSAHANVSRKLDELRNDARQARREEITTELLDLVTGAEALSGSAP
jgi:F-type H+-transporting ATPase subunit gamma